METGEKAPSFRLKDQFGREQSNDTPRGTNGTVLLFFRSADWRPFCKGQLVQLQNSKSRFEAQGIKLAAISYDSPAILKDFTDRHKIDFPLLADPDSKVSRSFHVLNEKADGMTRGMALPGFFYIDKAGVIREKYFEVNYVDRFTPNNVIAKLFPELTEEVSSKVAAPHLELALAQSDRAVIPGSRVSLFVDVGLPPDTHVYAPGVTGYKPIALIVQPSAEIEVAAAGYPEAKTLYLDAIKEKVAVFEGKFQIVQDVKIAASKALIQSLGPQGKPFTWTVS
ncbi:MAG: peroxiredoxin family protein [Terriglobales bacterium]